MLCRVSVFKLCDFAICNKKKAQTSDLLSLKEKREKNMENEKEESHTSACELSKKERGRSESEGREGGRDL